MNEYITLDIDLYTHAHRASNKRKQRLAPGSLFSPPTHSMRGRYGNAYAAIATATAVHEPSSCSETPYSLLNRIENRRKKERKEEKKELAQQLPCSFPCILSPHTHLSWVYSLSPSKHIRICNNKHCVCVWNTTHDLKTRWVPPIESSYQQGSVDWPVDQHRFGCELLMLCLGIHLVLFTKFNPWSPLFPPLPVTWVLLEKQGKADLDRSSSLVLGVDGETSKVCTIQ